MAKMFNKIATIYGLFYHWQVRGYKELLDKYNNELKLADYQNIVDIGCGTGALCRALLAYNLDITGIDAAESMVAVAKKKAMKAITRQLSINFKYGDILCGLPFFGKQFDVAISSYVLHGFKPQDRLSFYNEIKRITKYKVYLIDYNECRSIITDVAEFIEGGDYFNFIKVIKDELKEQFGNLQVINTGKRSAIYICEITSEPE